MIGNEKVNVGLRLIILAINGILWDWISGNQTRQRSNDFSWRFPMGKPSIMHFYLRISEAHMVEHDKNDLQKTIVVVPNSWVWSWVCDLYNLYRYSFHVFWGASRHTFMVHSLGKSLGDGEVDCGGARELPVRVVAKSKWFIGLKHHPQYHESSLANIEMILKTSACSIACLSYVFEGIHEASQCFISIIDANHAISVPRSCRLLAFSQDLRAGTTIICDRYAFSGVAYSAAKGWGHRTAVHSGELWNWDWIFLSTESGWSILSLILCRFVHSVCNI